MYNKWQEAVYCINQTSKEFRKYLQSILSNLLDFDKVKAFNWTKLIYRIQQVLRSEMSALLYCNSIVSKDWLIFFEAVAQSESLIHLEHKITSYTAKLLSQNKKIQADKSTDGDHNHRISHWSQGTNAQDNTQSQSQGRRSYKSRSNHRRGKTANNNRSASGGV